MRLKHIGIILMINFCIFLVLSVVDARPYRGRKRWGKHPGGPDYGSKYVKEGYKYQYLGGDDDEDDDDDDGDDKGNDDIGGGAGGNGRDGGGNGNDGGNGWDYHW